MYLKSRFYAILGAAAWICAITAQLWTPAATWLTQWQCWCRLAMAQVTANKALNDVLNTAIRSCLTQAT